MVSTTAWQSAPTVKPGPRADHQLGVVHGRVDVALGQPGVHHHIGALRPERRQIPRHRDGSRALACQ